MIVHRSNRTEELIESLAGVVGNLDLDPFDRETIVVQGRGMERWISMQLADRLGIWANPRFLFPRDLVEMLFAAVLGECDARPDPFARECLMWSVADLLPTVMKDPAFASVERYLADDVEGRKRLQLADRVAGCFDDYLTYRPKMILGWEQHELVGLQEDEAWQAILWRELVARLGGDHLARRANRFVEAMREGGATLAPLPERVSLFGVSTLPPIFLEALDRASSQVELHLFVLNPSREYWAEIASASEVRRARRAAPNEDVASLHLDIGHPLLASLGRLGRDFQAALEGLGYEEDPADLYRDPSPEDEGLLHVLQRDMLRLEERGVDDAPPIPLDSNDASLRIHSCHSPMREVEVLKDELLACFEECPGLEPRDVVVMMPDVETYAPFIEAVFGTDLRGAGPGRGRFDEGGTIPHRIADRGTSGTSEVVDAFGRGLDFMLGRFTAGEGLDLCSIECVRDRFGIAHDDIETLRDWVAGSGIRWAVDAADRKAAGQPESEQNTWRFGLDRLLLAYALPEGDSVHFGGVRPYREIDGDAAELLGCFAELCEFLFDQRTKLRGSRAPREWRDALLDFLDGWVAHSDDTAQEHLLIRRILDEIAEQADAAKFDGRIPLETMRAKLEQALLRSSRPHHFLSGGVTFCELVPMRSIPFRVVALLGMNDDAFPRIQRPPGFDLVSRAPLPGDRSTREDDRYLFLEALLSARDRLVITYLGQNIRTGEDLPPSVVVSELLDVVDDSFLRDSSEPGSQMANVSDAIVIRHPLQPFSPGYFDSAGDGRLFSYSALHREAAARLLAERSDPQPFVSAPLPEPEEVEGAGPARVELEELARFFERPARSFLERRLGMRISRESEAPSAREPFAVDGLDRWKLGDELVQLAVKERVKERVKGGDPSGALEAAEGTGLLPMGMLGRVCFEDIHWEAEALVGQILNVTKGEGLEPVEVDLTLDGIRIVGLLTSLWPMGQLDFGYSRVGSASELGLWVRHLVMNQMAHEGLLPGDVQCVTLLIGRPERENGSQVVRFSPVEDPATPLRELLRLHRLGLNTPIPLFPRASRAYAKTLPKKGPDAALTDAMKAYRGSGRGQADIDDVFIAQAFDASNPFAPADSSAGGLDFAAIAIEVFGPLLEHRRHGA